MSREILVVTPENIEIEYELAGIGSRFFANLIDTIWQIGILLIMLIIFGILEAVLGFISNAVARQLLQTLQQVATGLGLIAVFVVFWGYFIYYETVWNGQTPGKRQVGLRVLRDGGYPINIFAAIVRNLLRVVDGIPVVIVGILFAGAAANKPQIAAIGAGSLILTLCFLLFSGKYQRLGDFIAGTMVVKQRAPRVPTLEALAPPPRVLPEHLAAYALADVGKHVYEMTVPEYRAVRHAIDRRWQLPAPMQQTSAMYLAVPLMRRLGITPPPGVTYINYADLLEYLAVAFEQYRGVK
ncbi:transporter [Capsulimonas corticalis]|uniref:Transporter n=1 Tax=Capsulimonas corticalis TaxID=2219043 RepID=A0A402CPW2_9BACT|nr:RDD family protein [Capsulimonas corticalis]BDI32869.1 transporter [Capsulimonas corticalis]